jgi:hypothetical protein
MHALAGAITPHGLTLRSFASLRDQQVRHYLPCPAFRLLDSLADPARSLLLPLSPAGDWLALQQTHS